MQDIGSPEEDRNSRRGKVKPLWRIGSGYPWTRSQYVGILLQKEICMKWGSESYWSGLGWIWVFSQKKKGWFRLILLRGLLGWVMVVRLAWTFMQKRVVLVDRKKKKGHIGIPRWWP